jgi:hypothetical protein
MAGMSTHEEDERGRQKGYGDSCVPLTSVVCHGLGFPGQHSLERAVMALACPTTPSLMSDDHDFVMKNANGE